MPDSESEQAVGVNMKTESRSLPASGSSDKRKLILNWFISLPIWKIFKKWLTKPISISGIVLLITKLGGALILLPVVALLVWDQVMIWRTGPTTQRLEEREFLCTQFVVPEVTTEFDDVIDPELLEVQRAMLHVSLMKEKARSYVQPIGTIDRIISYLKCTSISGVSTSSISIEHTLDPDLLRRLQLTERVDMERYEFSYFAGKDGIFADQIPTRISQLWIESIDLAQSALAARSRDLAATSTSSNETVPKNTNADVVAILDGNWILIVGGDKSLDSAISQVEITRRIVKENNFSGEENITLMFVSGWYRTVIPFETRIVAENALNSLISDLPYGGYVRDISRWCGGKPSDTITTVQSDVDKDMLSGGNVELWPCSYGLAD